MTTPPRRPRRDARDPYGLMAPINRWIPLAAVVGLVVIALITIQLSSSLPLSVLAAPRGQASGGGAVPPAHTALPSNKVGTTSVSIAGSLVYTKAGNLWLQTGTTSKQLTTDGRASSPTWSPDGTWVYYIDTRLTTGNWPPQNPSTYNLAYQVLMRVHPDGTGKEDILSSLIQRPPSLKYFYWLLEPSISADGGTAAVISDGPNPDGQDTVLQFVNLRTRALQPAPSIPETAPLGHSSPTYSPDGTKIAFVMQQRDGSKGTPSIWLYDVARRSASKLSAAGYRDPAWSPDGRYLAATHHVNGKDDVVVLDGTTGAQVAQLTNDGASWMPVWSPQGNAIVYLNLDAQVIDLEIVQLTPTATGFAAGKAQHVTQDTGLDGTSKAAWYAPGAVGPAAASASAPASAAPSSSPAQ